MLSTFTFLGNRSPELDLADWNFMPIKQLISLAPRPWLTAFLFSFFINSTPLGTSCKGNPTVFVYLCRAYFTYHTLTVHRRCSTCRNSFFWLNNIPPYGSALFCLSIICPWALGAFTSSILWMLLWTWVCKYNFEAAFNSFGYIPKGRMDGSHGSPIFNFLRPTILFSIAVVIYVYRCPQCPK